MRLDLLLALLAAPVLLASGYLFLLTVLSRRPAPPSSPPPRLRFQVIVPAHDEEEGIGRTVESLLALDWPRQLFGVVVVADNCSDATATRAAAAGASVLIRDDASRRGKGYALELAFRQALEGGGADAVVVVDADTVVSPDLLAGFAARLEAGALALQASYRVLNPLASWRTRLMAIALALVHDVRSLGRERLGVSCGLKGNGMCFSVEALRRVPHRAFSIVEDLEYGLRLAEAGIRVRYVAEAWVRGEMVARGEAAKSQRARWEGGRRAMVRAHALPLLRRGLARRDPVLLDLAADLLIPPLARVVAWAATGAAVAAALWSADLLGGVVLGLWLAPGLFLAAYLLRGLQLCGLGLGGVTALAWAPAYVIWKALAVRSDRHREGEWVRTARERPPEGTRSP